MDEVEKELLQRLEELPQRINMWKDGAITNLEFKQSLQEVTLLLDEFDFLQEK